MMKIDPSRLPAPPAENQPMPAAQPSLETLSLLAQRRSTPIALMTGPGPSRAEIRGADRRCGARARSRQARALAVLVIEGAARERAGEKLAALVKQSNPNADEAQMKMERERLTRAPVVIAVISTAAPHPKIPEWEQVLSAGAASFQLVLAAHAMGYAGAWLTEWRPMTSKGAPRLGSRRTNASPGSFTSARRKPIRRNACAPDVKTRISWFE